MAWTETSAGVWERPLGDNEIFIKLAGDPGLPLGRENWAISAQASFMPRGAFASKPDQLEQILREAWKQYRYVEPSIATHVVDEKMVYEVPDDTKLNSWLKETFMVAAPGVSGSDVIATRKPTHYATLTYIPHDSRVVLATPHWRSDGVGIFLMLDVYFDLVAKCATGTTETLSWGSETPRLSIAVEEVAALSHEQTPEVMDTAGKCMATFGLVANNIGVKYKGDASTLPEGTRIKWIELSEDESSGIFAAAKARDLSVTSVVHASVDMANFHFAIDDRKDKPHVSTVRFGLRPYLPKEFAGPDHGATCYTSGYMYQADQDKSWAETARTVTDEYRKGYAHIMPAHRQYAKMLVDVMKNMPAPDPNNLPSDLDISSTGKVEPFIKPTHEARGSNQVDVMSVSFGVELITRQMVCFVWTFRGKLNLQIDYNEAYHDDDEVEAIVQYIKDRTKSELGVA